MVMWIIIGAGCFTHYLAFIGLQDSVQKPTAIGPILIPIVQALEFDLLWFGLLFVINMTLGYQPPPFGFTLFILKEVVPPSVTVGHL